MVLRLLGSAGVRLHHSKFLITLVFLSSCWVEAAHKRPRAAIDLKNLPPGKNILWQDPGNVAALDFVTGVAGNAHRPQPPFHFVEEEMSGTNPKVKVKDAKGVAWSVKWGEEARPSVFSTRLAWACGYNVETEYFVGAGEIRGAHNLKRAANQIRGDGHFIDARFQLRSDKPKFLSEYNWSWIDNPFMGSPQLNGLKILIMLLSNWDTKDARDMTKAGQSGTADSNLAIFAQLEPSPPHYLYLVSDWGATLGHWGAGPGGRSKWDCKAYSADTPDFVQGVDNGIVKWGYSGKHNDDITKNIRVSDVEWLMQYLGQVTDEQLRRGLAASNAPPEELQCFLTSIRRRITALQSIH